ncbi:MAG TPA: GNAT family N-acetyltransferase [Candidatus Nanopelagicales bacterium]|nr:GNAT family N-acetyltransferase [Candidatus Nanopelagicales bacterium]
MTRAMDEHLLHRIDRYLDAVPRAAADAVDVGPLRAFLSRAPWPYYARPRPDAGLPAPTADDVDAAARALTEHGSAVSFEWVHELLPSFAGTLGSHGYAVTLHPLLALELPAQLPSSDAQLLEAGSPLLHQALAVAEVAFSAEGTAIGAQGTDARDAVEVRAGNVEHIGGRIADGSVALAVVVDTTRGVVASGSHVPVDGVTEVMGVATLPAYRRRGLAASVVVRLLDDAMARGCTLALLSAADDDVARVYERVGFVRVGHAGAAEPLPQA